MSPEKETILLRLVRDAQDAADRSAATFRPFKQQVEGIQIVGSYPKLGGVEERVSNEFVYLSDLVERASGQNLLVEAIHRIENRVVSPSMPAA